ncbi:hypothetical protein HBN50_11490 [Halobacteriovorax sp. GB3]|uniref:hypothetical protein n=1 Tax=Halobacteriovorax sp. GB3 TaxID=2719615 RepID=UPI0023612B9D|nr:hypothetical protein [Halobacteriovorax sp. GB3]MDD0853724.1 hypothetical protein [Halobacteriovorax sp. GB3]
MKIIILLTFFLSSQTYACRVATFDMPPWVKAQKTNTPAYMNDIVAMAFEEMGQKVEWITHQYNLGPETLFKKKADLFIGAVLDFDSNTRRKLSFTPFVRFNYVLIEQKNHPNASHQLSSDVSVGIMKNYKSARMNLEKFGVNIIEAQRHELLNLLNKKKINYIIDVHATYLYFLGEKLRIENKFNYIKDDQDTNFGGVVGLRKSQCQETFRKGLSKLFQKKKGLKNSVSLYPKWMPEIFLSDKDIIINQIN